MIAAPLSDFLHKHNNADISVTVANTKELLLKLDAGEIDFPVHVLFLNMQLSITI